MSIGFFTKPEQAVIWRGPMATKALNQLIFDQSQELENLTPLEIAQKILKDPMKRGISYLTISDKDAESEEDY